MRKRVIRPINHSLILCILFFCCWNIETNAQCNLSCNTSIQVSIDEFCQAEISPDMILENFENQSCLGPIIVSIMDEAGNVIPTNPVISNDQVGQTVMVVVTDEASTVSCMGVINVEDKLKPIIDCSPITIDCNEDSDPNNIGYPDISDNCDDNLNIEFSDELVNPSCNPDHVAIINRTWTATDDSGNTTSCIQEITLARASIEDIVFPDNILDNPLDCDNPNLDISNTGVPTLNGQAVSDYCELIVTHSDDDIPLCANSYKVLRNWLVIDWCTGNIRRATQTIAVKDTSGPDIVCPDNRTVSTDFDKCTASLLLPNATATDDCSPVDSIVINVSWDFGTGAGPFYDIPVGSHIVTYVATDDCDNESTCDMILTIEDQVAPIAACDADTEISLGSSCQAKLFANVLDDGSSDNCAVDSFAIALMDVGVFSNCILFDDSFVDSTVMVIFRVYDTVGLYNECMVEVTISDKISPSINCTDVSIHCDQDSEDLNLTGTADATDNCAVDTIFYSDIATNIDQQCKTGTITRRWTVVDPQGRTGTCNQIITIIDTVPPVIFIPNDTMFNSCNIDTSALPQATATDNCGLLGVGKTDIFFEIDPCNFKIERTWRIIDWCSDLDSSEMRLIQIVDEQAPLWDQAAGSLDISFSCEETIVFPDPPTATDDCTEGTVSLVNEIQTTGTCYTITRTYEAVDNCGNVSETFSIVISVGDDELPIWTTPQGSLDNNFVCNADLVLPTPPIASDNCGTPIVTLILDTIKTLTEDVPLADEDCADKYRRCLSYQATDDCGNISALFLITLTVNDDVAPTWDQAMSSLDTTVACNEIILPEPTATDNCNTATIELVTDIVGPGACSFDRTLTYSATDECGNVSALFPVVVTVVDTVPPTWDQPVGAFDTIYPCLVNNTPLTSFPTASDACGLAFVLLNQGPQQFNRVCQDQFEQVYEFVARDICGNESEPYVVTITVRDTIAPVWNQPPGTLNRSFNCDNDVGFGTPSATDNCSDVTVSIVSDIVTDSTCANKYTRTITYQAVDLCNNISDPFIQTITVDDTENPIWDTDPADLNIECDGTDDPGGAIAAWLTAVGNGVASDNCSNLTYSNDFTALPNTCEATIAVTFTATDECGNNASVMANIILIDTIPPMIECPDDFNRIDQGPTIFDSDDCMEFLDIEPTVLSDNCTVPNLMTSFTGALTGTGSAATNYPLGETAVTFTATDECGNESSCTVNVEIIDGTAPELIVCRTNIPPQFVNDDNEIIIPIDLFASAQDNCSPPSTTVAYLNGEEVTDNFILNCDSLGNNSLEVIFTDTAGNISECGTTVLVFDNDECTPPPPFTNGPLNPLGSGSTIGGWLRTSEATYIDNVEIQISQASSHMADYMSDEGFYMLPNIPNGEQYEVRPSKNTDHRAGVSSIDIYLLMRHLLGYQALASPYQIIAADANNSGTITALDIAELRKIILHVTDEFINNESWRFIQEDFVFTDPLNPLEDELAESYIIDELIEHMVETDFIGIKIGDLNNSAIPDLQSNVRDVEEPFTLRIQDQSLKAGESYTVDFRASDFNTVNGFQFTLGFDKSVLDFEAFKQGAINDISEDNFGLALLDKGVITASWVTPQQLNIDENEVLFSFTFKAKSNTTLSRTLQINSRFTNAEAYTSNEERRPVNLQIDDATPIEIADFKLYQNRPNPFKEATIIGFDLPAASTAKLMIRDVSGKLIAVQESEFTKGYHEINIDHRSFPTTGVYFYELETNFGSITQKMILVE